MTTQITTVENDFHALVILTPPPKVSFRPLFLTKQPSQPFLSSAALPCGSANRTHESSLGWSFEHCKPWQMFQEIRLQELRFQLNSRGMTDARFAIFARVSPLRLVP